MDYRTTSQLKRLLLMAVIIVMTLGIAATFSNSKAYANGGHKTTLNVVGASEDVQWYYLTVDENSEDYYIWNNPYTIPTPLELILTEDGDMECWTIETSKLKECGPLTGVLLTDNEGNELQFIKAADKDKGIQTTDFPDKPYNSSYYGIYCLTAHPEKEYSYGVEDAYILENMLADVTTKEPTYDGDHSTIATCSTVNDTVDHNITLYFNGAEDGPAVPEEVQAVIDMIDNIGEITAENYLSKENEIAAAKEAYNALGTDELKMQVINYNDLIAAEADVDSFKLVAAQTSAKGDLDALLAGKTESDYDAEDWTALNVAINSGKEAIDAATTIGEVNTAKNEAESAVSAIKTKDQKAAEKLKDAKTSAKDDLDALLTGKKESDYDAEDWTALNAAIDSGKEAIDAATTIDEVNTAKSSAESAVSAIKTKDQKEADKIKKQKAAAKKFTVKSLKIKVKNRKFTLSWKRTKGATGYQVQYKLKSAKKFKTLKTLKKLKVTSRKLKKGKKYQFKVRTYTNVKGTKVYGKWTKVKIANCR